MKETGMPSRALIRAFVILWTLAVAFVAHAWQRALRGDLLFFAAAVLFVAVHGAVPAAWLRRPS